MGTAPSSGPAAPVAAAAAPVAPAAASVAAPVAAAGAGRPGTLAVTVVTVGLSADPELSRLSLAAQTRSRGGSRFTPTSGQMLAALERLGVTICGPNPVVVDCRPMARRHADFPSGITAHVGWHPVLCDAVATHHRFPEVCADFLAQWNVHADQWTRTVVLWCGQGRHRSVAFSRCVDMAIHMAWEAIGDRLRVHMTWYHSGAHHGQWNHLCDLCNQCLMPETARTRAAVQAHLVPRLVLPQ